jgi:hypothetical protein
LVGWGCPLPTSLGITRSFPRLCPIAGLVAVALLTLAPRPLRGERLACLIHAANVHSEPGSNPSKCAPGWPALPKQPRRPSAPRWVEDVLMVARCPCRHQVLLNRPPGPCGPDELGPRWLPSRINDLSRSTGLSKMRRHPKCPTPEAGVIHPSGLITQAARRDTSPSPNRFETRCSSASVSVSSGERSRRRQGLYYRGIFGGQHPAVLHSRPSPLFRMYFLLNK